MIQTLIDIGVTLFVTGVLIVLGWNVLAFVVRLLGFDCPNITLRTFIEVFEK